MNLAEELNNKAEKMSKKLLVAKVVTTKPSSTSINSRQIKKIIKKI